MRLSTQTQESARSAVNSGIVLLIADASVRGGVINLTKEATRLIVDNPDCAWAIDEVIARIAGQAAKSGVAVEF